MKRIIKDDYLSGAEALLPFYHYPFPDTDFTSLIADKSKDQLDRSVLRAELERQNEGLPLSDLTRENIQKLENSNTYTVTTGHQLCLMGGPMFTLYKILTVIRLAEELNEKHPEAAFVPIFWMAAEDHDAEEINHYFSSFEEKVSYIGAFGGAVGRHILEPSITDSIPAAYQQFFRPGVTLAQAFRELINDLFGKYGLVILDGDSPALKAQFRDVMEEELLKRPSLPYVEKASEALKELGYRAQVHPREINLFYLSEGRRDRLVWKEDHVEVLGSGKVFTDAELKAELAQYPERFSPNVILRPLYQEYILPNLAYAGGWGELSYWMQIKGVFDHFGVNFPLLIPRMNATMVAGNTLDRWKELGFEPADFRKEIHELNDQFLPTIWDGGGYEEHKAAFEPVYQALSAYVAQFEPTLSRSVEAEQAKTAKLLDKMEKKVKRAVRNRHPKAFAEIETLKNEVQPGRALQERTLNFSTFGLESDDLVALLHAHCFPLDPKHQWISLP